MDGIALQLYTENVLDGQPVCIAVVTGPKWILDLPECSDVVSAGSILRRYVKQRSTVDSFHGNRAWTSAKYKLC